MDQIHAILKQVWGYHQFRPAQEDIINSVLMGRDTLALLPTGGGKSLCFQVPTLAMEGVCIVVTPLIALMKDQVANLKARGVKAGALHTGMGPREIDLLLDNCIYGAVKFLYVSPERLKSELFLTRAGKMPIALLAIDEAHCISQWGYDFRPAYLEIAAFREHCPDAPLIALTASATLKVREDIIDKLAMRQPATFTKSFARPNLSYAVRAVEDKSQKLLEILSRVPGSAVVYARTRKETKTTATLLHNQGISADFYHGGLANEERSAKQARWVAGHTRVMVATNAFGMGIDKPDVRVVAHLMMPDSLEAYYQEAGRAGRDGHKAYAVLLYNPQDADTLLQMAHTAHPEPQYLRKVYQCLANHYKLAVGSGLGATFDLLLHEFAETYRLKDIMAYHAIKKLQEEGFLQLNESFFNPSKIYIPVSHKALYEFQVANATLEPFIKALLRVYGGELFTNYMNIDESALGKSFGLPPAEVKKRLSLLHQNGMVVYEPRKDQPQLTFLTPRHNAQSLPLNTKRLEERRKSDFEKIERMIHYARHQSRCRTLLLLDYFGETQGRPCGVCDHCLQQKQADKSFGKTHYQGQIAHVLAAGRLTIDELADKINPSDKDHFFETVREMLDAGAIAYDSHWQLGLPGQNPTDTMAT